MRNTNWLFKISYFLSSQFFVFLALLLLIFTSKLDKMPHLCENFGNFLARIFPNFFNFTYTTTLLIASRFIFAIFIACILGTYVIIEEFSNLQRESSKNGNTVIKKKNNINLVYILNQYNKGFRDFLLSAIFPLMTGFSFINSPLMSLSLLCFIEILLFAFFCYLFRFFP